MLHQGIGGGWLTAEYSMLPYSNSGERKPREITRGKPDGRSMEIQRFLGRALRAAICLKKMPSYTLWLDADVIQADGGTRTAALCGGYVAAHLAIQRAVNTGLFRDNPLQEAVGALSIGLCDAQPRVDLAYAEDVQAAADGHAVLTASGKIVELHLCGEQATFEQSQMDTLLELARRALVPVFEAQQAALAKALAAKPKL
jgi:ribonuclease PH